MRQAALGLHEKGCSTRVFGDGTGDWLVQVYSARNGLVANYYFAPDGSGRAAARHVREYEK